jgi:hypothetical protein
VPIDEICSSGQPHGFINFGFPAVGLAFERVGGWPRRTFAG